MQFLTSDTRQFDSKQPTPTPPRPSLSSTNLLEKTLLENFLERKGCKAVPVCLEEFVLELDPVQTQRVEKAFEHVHGQQHAEGDHGENEIALKVDGERDEVEGELTGAEQSRGRKQGGR